MLNIHESLDLWSLYEDFMKSLQDNWKNPFEPPVVIFADSKTEQWFRLFWLKNRTSKNSVIMNLRTEHLESFLFEALADGVDSEIPYEYFSSDLLKDFVIAKLISDVGGKKYYKTLGSKDIDSYIENADGSLNEIHLFDFAKSISNLFCEYETTRTDALISAWKNGKNFFEHCSTETEELEFWQRSLYKDVVASSGNHVTLSRLAEINKKANGGKFNFGEKKITNVYVLGFDGMGQIYRNILKEYSKEHDLELYVQNSSFTSVENPLLKKWGFAGSENLALWKENLEYKPVKSDSNKFETSTLLGCIQKQISENKNDPEEFRMLQKDGSVTLSYAPSMLREVEVLHSKICKLMHENPELSYSDFIVLAPNVQDYRVPLLQVFDQNREFLGLPYVLADYSAERSLIADALEILLSMLTKKALYRNDFFELLRNPVIQFIKGISYQEVNAWASWVSELNIYRDRPASENEWKTGAKRMLLSRLTENPVVLGNGETEEHLLPFSDMEGENDSVLYKFVDCVDSLEEWIAKFSATTEISISEENNQLEEIHTFLQGWLKFNADGKEIPSELSAERIVWRNVDSEFRNLKLLNENGIESINKKCLMLSLMTSAQTAKGSSNRLFAGGITFANLSANRVIPAKYVFVIGLGSKQFPGMDTQNVLDLRVEGGRIPGDESISEKNKNAFMCQLLAAEKGFFLSYVSKDLQKDEEFFRSSVVNDLFNYIKASDQKIRDLETEITLDENRSWSELFSQREFRNKRNYSKLTQVVDKLQIHGDKNSPVKNETSNLPDKVSIYQLKTYLNDPFRFNIQNIFDCSEDSSEEEKIECEPIDFDGLTHAIFLKKLIENSLQPSEDTEIDKENLKNLHALPDGFFGEEAFVRLKRKAEKYVGKIKNDFPQSEFVFGKTSNVRIKQNQEKSWLLTGDTSWHSFSKRTDAEGKTVKVLTIVEIVSGNLRNHHILTPYLSSLSLLSELDGEDSYEISLNILYSFGRGVGVYTNTSVRTPESARELLRNMYENAFIQKNTKCMPLNLVKNKNIESLAELKNLLLGDNGEWENFSKARLFDVFTDIGYEAHTFYEEWEKMKSGHLKLLDFAFADEI